MMDAFAPKELIQDIPYITMTGDSMLYIEHHHGMISYCPEKIVLDTGCGLVTVAGSNLTVDRYTSREAGLKGRIDTVTLRESSR